MSVNAVGIPVQHETFAVVCTGLAPSNVTGLATVSVQWQLNGAEFTNSTLEGVSITSSESMAMLNFSSIDNATHGRSYTCVATLRITDVPMTRNGSTTYLLLTLSKFLKFSIVNKDQGLMTSQSDKSFLGVSSHYIVKNFVSQNFEEHYWICKMKAKIKIGQASVLPEKNKFLKMPCLEN